MQDQALNLGDFGSRLKRFRLNADSALAALVLTIVAMMILPLPTWLLDILISANIAMSVLLVLIAISAPNALSFASFPTVLLITTLFRLGLNVSSTRLILLQADAGEVITAFGEFVVRGNYVVGAIVFLILTLIQFIVIAKGSERVAEVGARFALDAMPGKQMSVDADLRSGAISQDEAKSKRRNLEREAQFYGAMDGAMKFVKGDAIAGIIIVAINLIGGVIVGITGLELSAMESFKTFGLLSIGDGLVSQIPALLISTAAGMLVTRVASEDELGTLSSEVNRQVLGNVRVLKSAAVFLVLLAVVPGMPTLPFLILSGCLYGGARLGKKNAVQLSTTARPSPKRKKMGHTALPEPLGFLVGDHLYKQWLAVNSGSTLQDAIGQARQRVIDGLGAPVPMCVVRVDPDIAADAWAFRVDEVPAERGTIEEADEVTALMDKFEQHLRKHAHVWVTLQSTQDMLDALEVEQQALIRHAVPKPVTLGLLTEVLKRLVEEQVSIRFLPTILEALVSMAGSGERDPVFLTEHARAELRRHITYRVASDGVLRTFVMDPAAEDAIRHAVQRTAGGTYLALEPGLARDITRSIVQGCQAEKTGDLVVLLTQPDVRRYVWKLAAQERPLLMVVSYAELNGDVRIEPLGTVGVSLPG